MTPAHLTPAGKCPVCEARFRGSRLCSRCGADLAPLMVLSCQAWKLRDAARGALIAGKLENASRFAEKAQQTHRVPAGDALMAVSRLLRKSLG